MKNYTIETNGVQNTYYELTPDDFYPPQDTRILKPEYRLQPATYIEQSSRHILNFSNDHTAGPSIQKPSNPYNQFLEDYYTYCDEWDFFD